MGVSSGHIMSEALKSHTHSSASSVSKGSSAVASQGAHRAQLQQVGAGNVQRQRITCCCTGDSQPPRCWAVEEGGMKLLARRMSQTLHKLAAAAFKAFSRQQQIGTAPSRSQYVVHIIS